MFTLASTLRGTAMSMKKSGRPRRSAMISATPSRVTMASEAPVDVMTMSASAMAVSRASKGTAVPASARAISCARAHVRLVT